MFEYWKPKFLNNKNWKLKCLVQTHNAYGQKIYNTVCLHKHPHKVIICFEPFKRQ
jgi:hypothetical protein